MLEQAQLKLRDHRVRYQLGRGAAIPLANRSVDLIFTSMTFHHFDDPLLMARECPRVLQDSGAVVLRTGTRERIPSYLTSSSDRAVLKYDLGSERLSGKGNLTSKNF